MKSIIISPHDIFPPQSGGERRIYLLAKEHSKTHHVMLLGPLLRNRHQMDLNIHVVELFPDDPKEKFFNRKLMVLVLRLVRKYDIDLIQVEFPWQGFNLLLLKAFYNTEYTLDEHNVEFLRFKREGSVFWPLVFAYEFLVCHFSKMIICVSETDKAYLKRFFKISGDRITVIENPVDTSLFFPCHLHDRHIRNIAGVNEGERLIMFFGNLDYNPNIEAVHLIFSELLPILSGKNLKFKICICGKGSLKGSMHAYEHRSERVVFLGLVERIQDYINAADIVIAPLTSGSGTRIKILESLACETTVISTSIGAEGIDLAKFADNLIIRDDWEGFCNAILRYTESRNCMEIC